jgi:hypothetical protein
MDSTAVGERFPRPERPSTGVLMAWLVVFEAGLVVSYVLTTDAIITDPLFLVYPFVWIDASVWALLRTDRPTGSTRARLIAGVIAVGYFLVLGYFGGLFGVGTEQMPMHLNWGPPPGYGPALIFDSGDLFLILEPFKVVGYLTLAYFVYATVLDAAAGAVSGLLGLFTCVSCSWPILGTIVTSVFGGGSAVAAVATGNAYGLGTVIFVSALALLYYRPLV